MLNSSFARPFLTHHTSQTRPRCTRDAYNLLLMPLSPGTNVQLFLNGRNVGSAVLRGHDHGWYFGDFTPSPAFSEFAPLYGQWSLLMHAEDDRAALSPAASEELRLTEIAMDQIQARIFVPATQQWHSAVEINIDGPLIEWHEA